MQKQRKYQGLSKEEQREVLRVIQLLKSRRHGDNDSSDCREAKDNAERYASDLEGVPAKADSERMQQDLSFLKNLRFPLKLPLLAYFGLSLVNY